MEWVENREVIYTEELAWAFGTKRPCLHETMHPRGQASKRPCLHEAKPPSDRSDLRSLKRQNRKSYHSSPRLLLGLLGLIGLLGLLHLLHLLRLLRLFGHLGHHRNLGLYMYPHTNTKK